MKSIASAVEFEPAPAITGTRLAATSMHSSMTRLCSSWESVGLSPVVPTGTFCATGVLEADFLEAVRPPSWPTDLTMGETVCDGMTGTRLA